MVSDYDRAEVIADLADCRREAARLKREAEFYKACRESWTVKAVAAQCAGDEEAAEIADAFGACCADEAQELLDRRGMALNIIRLLEKELTK